MAGGTLLIGLGSAHGDDQIGLLVADEIKRRVGQAIDVQFASSPAAMLDHLDSRERVVICDACISSGPPGTLHRWNWPTTELQSSRFTGSHDVTLPAALDLADELGRLPREVTIWGIAIGAAQPGTEMSPALAAAAPAIVEQICQALELAEHCEAAGHA